MSEAHDKYKETIQSTINLMRSLIAMLDDSERAEVFKLLQAGYCDACGTNKGCDCYY